MKSTLLCLKFEVYSLFQSFYFLHNIQTLPVKAHFLNLACNISSWQTKVYALLAIIYTCTLSTNLHHRKSNLSIREITALITKHLHLIAVTILSPPPPPSHQYTLIDHQLYNVQGRQVNLSLIRRFNAAVCYKALMLNISLYLQNRISKHASLCIYPYVDICINNQHI